LIPQTPLFFPVSVMSGKFLVSSALVISVAAVLGMSNTVQAAEVAVPFDGVVRPACEFSKPTAGTLTVNNEAAPTQLSSKNASGAAGQVLITCNTATAVSARGYQPNNEGAKRLIENSEISYSLTAPGQEEGRDVKVEAGQTEIGVNLEINSKENIPVGKYSYDVIITATP
jgi:hypothetical protein